MYFYIFRILIFYILNMTTCIDKMLIIRHKVKRNSEILGDMRNDQFTMGMWSNHPAHGFVIFFSEAGAGVLS